MTSYANSYVEKTHLLRPPLGDVRNQPIKRLMAALNNSPHFVGGMLVRPKGSKLSYLGSKQVFCNADNCCAFGRHSYPLKENCDVSAVTERACKTTSDLGCNFHFCRNHGGVTGCWNLFFRWMRQGLFTEGGGPSHTPTKRSKRFAQQNRFDLPSHSLAREFAAQGLLHYKHVKACSMNPL